MSKDRDDWTDIPFDGGQGHGPRDLGELAKMPPVRLTIDGKPVEVPLVSFSDDPAGRPIARHTTIYDAAAKLGIAIPVLCHREYMNPIGVCRVCCVEAWGKDREATEIAPSVVDAKLVASGERLDKSSRHDGWIRNRVLFPACNRWVENGMEITTHRTDDRVCESVRTVLELLMADHPEPCEKEQRDGTCELEGYARTPPFQVRDDRIPERPKRHQAPDESSVVIKVDHNACILCDRCIRGCNDIRENRVMGRRGKGYATAIAFDLDDPMGNSTCVSCGECMVSCPTGALTFRAPVEPEPWKDLDPRPMPVTTAELAKLPLFAGVAHAFLSFNEGAVVRRKFQKGDVICREGEYGFSAFYIESGTVNISITSPLKHVKASKGGIGGWFRRMKYPIHLVGRSEDKREEESAARFIHVDAPVSLPYDKPVAQLRPGDIFGEMACMNHWPRSATVVAADNCTVLEMLRNVVSILQRSKASRAILEEQYRSRAIDNHLRSVPLFAGVLRRPGLFEKVANYLRSRVELVRLNPGDVIVRQGDEADDFYLVRLGFVKVSQKRVGGEHVLNYLGPGNYFGEIAFLSHLPGLAELVDRPGRRTATCAALDHVDVVRVKGGDFRAMLGVRPPDDADDTPPPVSVFDSDERDFLLQEFVRVARERIVENERTFQRIETEPLEDYLDQGLFEAQSLLVLDLERCTRCDECTKACSDSHDGVTRLIREGLRFDKYLVASSCRSCLDPYCMVGCPVGSIRRRGTREIIIEDWCIGCGQCAKNCPYGNINMHGFKAYDTDPKNPDRKIPIVKQKATTCDLCTEIDGKPSCVYACPHDAAFRMTGPQLLDQVR